MRAAAQLHGDARNVDDAHNVAVDMPAMQSSVPGGRLQLTSGMEEPRNWNEGVEKSTANFVHHLKPYSPSLWDTDRDLVHMRRHDTAEFRRTHKAGVEHYLHGDWEASKDALEKASGLIAAQQGVGVEHGGGDPASKALLAFMREHEFTCPPDWKGYRRM